jgi:hypothetical protein
MPTLYQPLFPEALLASRWSKEYESFRGSLAETSLLKRLSDWAEKSLQKETAAEGAFVGSFFKQTWGYVAAGEGARNEGYTCEAQYAVKRSGQAGGTGIADLALGYFERAGVSATPQVICEFKDVRSGLDKPQNRKGNDRSPVKQCADYLKEAANELYGTEPIQPSWGIVTDMNEFRLYWRKKMPAEYQRFLIKGAMGEENSLLGDSEGSRFQRFLFWKLFQKDMLLTTGGASPLERILTEQWVQERVIESDFYREYQAYRQEVFQALVTANPQFNGTRSKLVRLTQRFLDRCIFILFCEDMGSALNFPPNILRDVLIGVSTDPDYDGTDDAIWIRIKRLFVAMRDGSPFREHRINRFNGGLFAEEPDLESLHIPSRLFCLRGQGANADDLVRHKKTLLFFSANYNFGLSGGTFERSIGLTTLGRIFEQSITELEFMEAEADGRPSVTELSKRKRDGVYYTPGWVTSYIVDETVGALLAKHRKQLALDPLPVFAEEELERYRNSRASGKKDRRFKAEQVEAYLVSLDTYARNLDDIKVVDPACGSGAFLIQALDRLVSERRWLATERERVTGTTMLFDADSVVKSTLSNNIYGVDINQESIEITRLALWLHTALPDRPLTSLDDNIRCGNSLISSDFYRFRQMALFSQDERDRINVFDWKEAFPKVFARPNGMAGFDCVIGNPPYVKLQHFKQVLPDVAEYLIAARSLDGAAPLYASTQTQNFDMYLPFIERGIDLLNEQGHMGYIAPSVWLLNEYGHGLRNRLLQSRRLERWVDFRDFPVFEEAMTYTALQFFRGCTTSNVKCAFAADGEVGSIEWSEADAVINYSALPSDDVWLFLPERERELVERLSNTCTSLSDVATGIIVGIQTSADDIFHLERLGPGRYRQFPKKAPPVDVAVEDGLMRPLVSGEEAKRYLVPSTNMYLLFPYDDTGPRSRLLTVLELERTFPQGWAYLLKHSEKLRQREKGAFNDDSWYRFGRNQNIDRQKSPKLGVGQTVPEMRVFFDEHGDYCFNNVRVNGILSTDSDQAFFLLGVLNSRVVDFVFRRIAKSKERRPSGAYFEANKQYISPLPIPRVAIAHQRNVIALARELQGLHTKRRMLIVSLTQRLASEQFFDSPRPIKWLWADVGDLAFWTNRNVDGLSGRALATWANKMSQDKAGMHLAEIQQVLFYGATMCAAERDGEMRFFVADHCVIAGVYVSKEEAPLVLAQWRHLARDTFVSDTVDAAKIVKWLLDLKMTENHALIQQISELNRSLEELEATILARERFLDDLLYDLYGLTENERMMVETDTGPRWKARITVPPIL